MSFRTFALVLGLFVCIGSSALADTALPYVGSIVAANTEEASIFVLPDGSGPPLTAAFAFGGQLIDASITLELVGCWGSPIDHFPPEDIWLESETETSFSCAYGDMGSFYPDSETDFNGITSFTSSLAGGGWTEGPVWVYVWGSRAMEPLDCPYAVEHPPVPLRFNSADINGDGAVTLPDVTQFSTDFFGEYHYRSDFVWDGVLNLSDVILMANGLGSACE